MSTSHRPCPPDASRPLKVVMFAHRLEVGGTQVNAIELADTLQRRQAARVTLFATPGPMARLALEKGLHVVAAPDAVLHPSLARARALRELVRSEQPDLVHAWDWWQCLDACCAIGLGRDLPLVVSDMMMEPTRVLPRHLPTTFGTPEVVELARRAGRTRARLLLPPVDVEANSPNALHPLAARAFRRAHGIDDEVPLLVTVSRLSTWMKADSLVRTIEAVGRLGRHHALCFAIVGTGLARERLQQLADQVNAALGRRAVLLCGALLDPRPAYAAADIVLGMGGSALRAMAFGKPVIVTGDGGFCDTLDEGSADRFHYTGYYGRAHADPQDVRIDREIARLLTDAERRDSLGRFSRRHVVQHHALAPLADELLELYRDALTRPVPRRRQIEDALRTSAIYLRERRFLSRSRDPCPDDRVEEPVQPAPAGALPPQGVTR